MRRHQPSNSQNATIRRFGQKVTVISYPLEGFRRIKCQITAVYAQNIVHALLSVEASPTTRKT
jgi:hypothetical protein